MTAIPDAPGITGSSAPGWATGRATTGPAGSPTMASPAALPAESLASLAISERRTDSLPFGNRWAPARAVGPPLQLPPPPAPFLGREKDLRRLVELLSGAREPQTGTTVVHLRGHCRGVGTSALAVYWLHQHQRSDFPGGQLYADLSLPRPHPALAILDEWLRALGLAPQSIPRELDERSVLLRKIVGNQPIALLLDNADHVEDAELLPLIPTMPRGLVLVTSARDHPHLAVHRAIVLPIHPLDRTAVFELFTAIAGPGRAGSETGLFRDLDVLVQGRPLPLTVSAACLAAHPQLTLRDLIGNLWPQLRATGHTTAEGTATVTSTEHAVYETAYQRLSPAAQRAYRALGVHPRAWFDRHALAAATTLPPATIDNLITELHQVRLINRNRDAAASWMMGPEIWDHAHQFATVHAAADTDDAAEEVAAARDAAEDAFAQIAAYYLSALRAANRVINPARPELPTSIDLPAVLLPDVSSFREAIRWVLGNWFTMLDVQAQVVGRGRYDLALLYLHALDLVGRLHGYDRELLPAITRLRQAVSGRMTHQNLLLLAELAVRNALDGNRLSEALTYVAEMDTLAATVRDTAAAARALRLRAQISLAAGHAAFAAREFQEHLLLLDEAAAELAAEHAGPLPDSVWDRVRALDHIDLCQAMLDLGKPEDARAHAEIAQTLLLGPPQEDEFNLARARRALVEATLASRTASSADDVADAAIDGDDSATARRAELAELTQLAFLAANVFNNRGADRELARAVRVTLAVTRYREAIKAARPHTIAPTTPRTDPREPDGGAAAGADRSDRTASNKY